MTTSKQTGFADLLTTLDKTLTEYLVDKAPALPTNIKELIVKLTPWLTLIFLILALPALLFLFGLGSFLTPLAFLGGAGEGTAYIITMVFSLIVVILEAMAIPGLFNRTRTGWMYLFYATLIGGVQNIVTFNIGGLIIGTLLSLYLLYQVKTYYK
ncbi:MAG: hypothetical protein ACEQSA_03600 [Weeksellaceae bacterium]